MTHLTLAAAVDPRISALGEALRTAKVISARIERELNRISWYFSARIPPQCAIEIESVDSSQTMLQYLSSYKPTILNLFPQKAYTSSQLLQ